MSWSQDTAPLVQPLRPQSAHPALLSQPLSPGHLAPAYSETRRSSLPGPPGFTPDPGQFSGHETSGAENGGPVTTEECETEQSSEVWQDIVRQLAVS